VGGEVFGEWEAVTVSLNVFSLHKILFQINNT
jgi:hypothetical protein